MDQHLAANTPENDVTTHQILVWALYIVTALAIAITYARLPASTFYHVSEEGRAGGLGRTLVFLNFSTSVTALAMVGVAVHRLDRSGMLSPGSRRALTAVALVAALLCFVTAIPGVVDQGDLDAKLVNALPGIGVVLALGLTLVSVRASERYRSLPWTTRDRIGLAIIAVLFVIALPWILADVGVYVDDISGVGGLYMSSDLIEDEALRAVHLGHHHGFDGYLFVVSSLVLGRLARGDVGSRLASLLRGYLSLMFSYGLLNLANDAWLEQIVKRGWTDWELPNFLQPTISVGWLLILVGAVISWALLFRPTASESTSAAGRTPRASDVRSPA